MTTASTVRFLDQWRLVAVSEPFQTATSTVQFVEQQGTPCVLKLAREGSGEETSASALLHFAGRGAIRLLAHDGGASLLQRAQPGTPLSRLVVEGQDNEATAVICDIIATLHNHEPPTTRFPTIEDWGRGFTSAAASALPANLVARAAAIYFEQCNTQTKRVLLHGDLHHDNILSDAKDGWLAIDPKGVYGEAEYEVGAALRNPIADKSLFADIQILDRRLNVFCSRLGWDRDRLLRWCFAQAVLSAIWSIEDSESPENALALAQMTDAMV